MLNLLLIYISKVSDRPREDRGRTDLIKMEVKK